jgi:DHA1 family inner membrane transport protein
MSFFRNDAINRVNLQSGVQALAQNAGGLFVLVFLLRAGVSVPHAFLAQASIVAGRFVIRPALLPLARRLGLKPLLIAGAVSLAAQYPILAEVHGLGPAFLAFCAASALGEVLYFVSYNAYFAALGDLEHRGRQVAVGQALSAAAGVVAPVLGGWALVAAGPRWTFGAVALVQMASAIPLLGLPNVPVRWSAPGAWRAAWPAVALIAVDGWFDAAFFFVWQIALFLTLGESYSAYGGAMALAGLAGALAGLAVGHHTDLGQGRRTVTLAYAAAAAVVLLRADSLGLPVLAPAANALGGLVVPLLVPPLASAVQNLAKSSPCSLRVMMATEGGWDVGCFTACLLAAGLAALKAPLWLGVLLALPAITLGWRLLLRQYPRPT